MPNYNAHKNLETGAHQVNLEKIDVYGPSRSESEWQVALAVKYQKGKKSPLNLQIPLLGKQLLELQYKILEAMNQQSEKLVAIEKRYQTLFEWAVSNCPESRESNCPESKQKELQQFNPNNAAW